MRASELLGAIFLVFDYQKGWFVAGNKAGGKSVGLLNGNEQLALINQFSSKNYNPRDFLQKIFKESKKQVYGRVFECEKKPRSDLFVFCLITSSKVQIYELKTLLVIISEIISELFPNGFTILEEGYEVLNLLDPEKMIVKGDGLKIGDKIIKLRKLRQLASKYGIDSTIDILEQQLR